MSGRLHVQPNINRATNVTSALRQIRLCDTQNSGPMPCQASKTRLRISESLKTSRANRNIHFRRDPVILPCSFWVSRAYQHIPLKMPASAGRRSHLISNLTILNPDSVLLHTGHSPPPPGLPTLSLLRSPSSTLTHALHNPQIHESHAYVARSRFGRLQRAQ